MESRTSYIAMERVGGGRRKCQCLLIFYGPKSGKKRPKSLNFIIKFSAGGAVAKAVEVKAY